MVLPCSFTGTFQCAESDLVIHFTTAPYCIVVFSAMDSGLVKKAKDLLNHHAFGTDPSKGMSQDYNKPLIIPAWSDSFEAITGSPVTGDQRQNLELWKHQFTTKFPQTVSRLLTLSNLISSIFFHHSPTGHSSIRIARGPMQRPKF